MSDYDRVREMIRDEAAKQNLESLLLGLMDGLVTRIDADPELRRALIREHVRSAVFSSFWLPSSMRH